jgi:glycosyltransferase involved in cell wall biosynthesis
MRILFVAPRFHTNQVEVIRSLVACGHNVWFHVATIGPVEDHSEIVPHLHRDSLASRLLIRLFGRGVNNFWYLPEPVSYWREFCTVAPDVAVIRWHNPIFCWLVGLYARLRGCRVVVYEQISPDLLAAVWSRGLMGWLRRARFQMRMRLLDAAWMTPLPGVAPLPSGGFFVPFAVPVAPVRPRPSSAVRLLEIGKFVPRKNHLTFIRAVAEIARDTPASATIVGECSTASHRESLEHARSAIEELGLQDRVSIQCNVPHGGMSAIYDRHDVFVLPASAEPAAISPLEAMGHGLPAVVTDECGTKGYIDEGVSGFICRSADVHSLTHAIKRAAYLSEDPATRDVIAGVAERRFSGDAFLKAFMAMLDHRFGLHGATTRAGMPMSVVASPKTRTPV